VAIKSLVSSAWQEDDTLKVPVSGAYQDADHANALVNSAWQEVWCKGFYFLQDGYAVNDADISSDVSSGNLKSSYSDGYRMFQMASIPVSSVEEEIIEIPFTSDMIGKTMVVVCHPNYEVAASCIKFVYQKHNGSNLYQTSVSFDNYDPDCHTYTVVFPSDASISGKYCFVKCYFGSNSVSYGFKDIYIK